MDPSVAMAKLLAAALENRLNAPVPDGESGTQHTSCAKAPCFIAKDYCLQAARLHGGSRTASPHVVPPLCRFACNWQHGAAMRACRSTAGATAFGAGGCALADAAGEGRDGGGGAAKGRMNTESGVWKAAASGALSDTSLYLSRAF